jgi:hypothetical protein
MYPGKYDIKQYQGATLDYPIWYRSGGILVNLTSYTAKMQLRTRVDSAVVVLELSTTNGRILLGSNVTNTTLNGGVKANVQLLVSASVMASLAAGQYVYDLDLTNASAYNTPILYGAFTLTGEVTR